MSLKKVACKMSHIKKDLKNICDNLRSCTVDKKEFKKEKSKQEKSNG